MGEENRESSSGGTVLIVVGILGGLLLLGCVCGGIVLGGSLFAFRSAEIEARRDMLKVEMQAQQAQQEFQRANQEMQQTNEKVRQEIEAVKFPESPPLVPPPEIAPVPSPPGLEEKRE